ncbi:MAG TPA: hypothetical protein VGK17_24655 [Propionicimonas sp.]|jgi:hypothetical protein
MAASGFVVGLFVADLWPGIGVSLGGISLLLAIGLLLWRRSPRWIAWLAAGLAAGVMALFLLALLQMLNPSATPDAGSGSGLATPR